MTQPPQPQAVTLQAVTPRPEEWEATRIQVLYNLDVAFPG